MKSLNPNVAWACATVLLLTILAGIFALAYEGKISGASALTVVVSIVGIISSALGVHAGVTVATKNQSTNQEAKNV